MPNRLGKMSENRRGDFLTHTVDSLNGWTDLFSF